MKPLTGALLVAGTVLLVASAAQAAGGGGGGAFDYDAYRQAIGVHESGGNYGAVNTLGYIGKYQFGAAALVDLGYIKLAVYQQYPADDKNACLRDSDAWIAPHTRAGFLADGPEQEKAMERLTAMNRRSLVGNGIITTRSSAVDQGAWLAIAHGLGAGAANKLYRTGQSKPDAYGTNAAQLHRIGSYSQRHPYALSAANKNAVKNGSLV
jgi:hypothetical protein